MRKLLKTWCKKKRTENDSGLNSLYLLESTKKQRRNFWENPKKLQNAERKQKTKTKVFLWNENCLQNTMVQGRQTDRASLFN